MRGKPKFAVKFYSELSGNEPVREWLKALSSEEKKIIGADIQVVQFSWPIGMPLVDSLGSGLWEIRSHFLNRIARIVFIIKEEKIILLNAFMKKTEQTPKEEINLARKRQRAIIEEQRNDKK